MCMLSRNICVGKGVNPSQKKQDTHTHGHTHTHTHTRLFFLIIRLGVGLGSFINSTWNNSGVKNCEFQYHDGVMYVVAIKFMSYNTELFTTYGNGYNYNTMQ
jgi:hypothetical protein